MELGSFRNGSPEPADHERERSAAEVEAMAKASRKKMGPGAHGKHAGTGAMTDVDAEKIPDAGVLSNRDKS
jgi:hypothetical protein